MKKALKIFGTICLSLLYLLAIDASVELGIKLYCNHERTKSHESGWTAVGDTPFVLIDDVLYVKKFPNNKKTIWLMEHGY